MARVLDKMPFKVYLIDSATGKSLVGEKAIDFTDACPGLKPSEKARIVYTRAQRGLIAILQKTYEIADDSGVFVHYFVGELEAEMAMAPRDDTFGSWAKRLGLSKADLRALIEQHAPTTATA